MGKYKSLSFLYFFRYSIVNVFGKFITFASEFGFLKRETFRFKKIKKLSKTENFP